MRGRMSFVGAVLRGLLVFTAMTASLAVALFIAVTGPPSNDEMRGLRIVADQAVTKFEEGTRDLGSAVCTQLPQKWKVAAECESDDVDLQQAKAESPQLAPPPQPSTPVQIADAPTSDESRLLGADEGAPAVSTPVVMAPIDVRADPPRRVRATAHRPAHTQRATVRNRTHVRAPAHRPTPVRARAAPTRAPHPQTITAPPRAAEAHTTPVVAPERDLPHTAEPAVAVPHAQIATPEPRVAAAPASAAPSDDADSQDATLPNDEQLEKQDPNQPRTF